jgi:hypothetical protein
MIQPLASASCSPVWRWSPMVRRWEYIRIGLQWAFGDSFIIMLLVIPSGHTEPPAHAAFHLFSL